MQVFHQSQNSMGNHTYNVYIYDKVNFDLHFHKNYEIVYVISGQAVYSVNGKTKTLEQGDFAFCLSNEIHSVNSIGESKIWIGVFSEDFIHEFTKQQKGRTGADFSFKCPESLMRYLSENLIKTELSDIFLIKSCLYALCSEYLKQIPLEENRGKKASIMGAVVEYVEKNYKKPISLATLAESLGYEYCYFSKIFNRLFSMRFNDYINIYRFNEACAMLRESNLSITEISYESGFQNARSFNNTFKRLSGVSPSQWRSRTSETKSTNI